jgi:hypothetical protein
MILSAVLCKDVKAAERKAIVTGAYIHEPKDEEDSEEVAEEVTEEDSEEVAEEVTEEDSEEATEEATE